MGLKGLTEKTKGIISKYKYAAIVLVVGLLLLLLPGKTSQQTDTESKPETVSYALEAEALAEILQSIQGAGKVQVLLSTAYGEKTVYQTDSDTTSDGDSSSIKNQTVIITDSQRGEAGLVSQVNPPTYLGAIVVCQGADSAAVKLAVTQAVAKITGLGTDSICVLKMK